MTKPLAIFQRKFEMMNLIVAPVTSTMTPAQKRNAKYSSTGSKLIDPAQRISDCLNFSNMRKTELMNVQQSFLQANPHLTANNMPLPLAHMIPLSEILIDDTMNRPVNWQHLMNIIQDFNPILVDSIRVYVDKEYPNKYIAWDGQHTTLALYIIYSFIFGVDVNKVMVPVTINPSTDKKDIRLNFIKHNSSTKKGGVKEELSNLDLFGQQVFGVRIDKSNDSDWIDAEAKQTALEDGDLFLTAPNEKVSLSGAILQSEKIINAPVHIVEMFCRFQKAKTFQKEVIGQEIVIILELMEEFHKSNIELTDDDFSSMVAIFYRSFKLNFSGKNKSALYSNLDTAFEKWYQKTYKLPKPWNRLSVEEKKMYPERQEKLTEQGKFQSSLAVVYLVALLQKYGKNNTTLFDKIPVLDNPFKPDMKDVF